MKWINGSWMRDEMNVVVAIGWLDVSSLASWSVPVARSLTNWPTNRQTSDAGLFFFCSLIQLLSAAYKMKAAATTTTTIRQSGKIVAAARIHSAASLACLKGDVIFVCIRIKGFLNFTSSTTITWQRWFLNKELLHL